MLKEDVIAVAYYILLLKLWLLKLIYNGTEWVMTQKAISVVDRFYEVNGLEFTTIV